jgi:hypothetical protein
VTVARANAVKNVWVRTPHIGSRKTAKINFTHFVGTVSGSDCAIKSLDGVRATLRMTFPARFEFRAPCFCFDLPFVAAKLPQITQNAAILEKRNLQFWGAQAAGL